MECLVLEQNCYKSRKIKDKCVPSYVWSSWPCSIIFFSYAQCPSKNLHRLSRQKWLTSTYQSRSQGLFFLPPLYIRRHWGRGLYYIKWNLYSGDTPGTKARVPWIEVGLVLMLIINQQMKCFLLFWLGIRCIRSFQAARKCMKLDVELHRCSTSI